MDDYIFHYTIGKMSKICQDTLDEGNVRYFYGLFYFLLMDRFIPEWKEGFLEEGRTQDGVLKDFLNISEEDLQAQLVPLMHADLIKELSDKDKFYLKAID